MLDNTGCQAMAAADYWNTPVNTWTVAANSTTKIAYAATQISGAPNLNAPYRYEVVPAGAALYGVKSTSSHAVPANIAAPTLVGWPIPADMAALVTTGDEMSELIQLTSPSGDCRGWDGYGFTGAGTSYSAYSGDHVQMNGVMPAETCNGVASLCGEDIEGDLTYYEMNANTGSALGVVSKPILHALHAEWPCNVSGTCGGTVPVNAMNASFNCRDTCTRVRLNPSLVVRPSDPNAAALYDALVNYGMDTSENGCCWGIYTIERADNPGYPSSIPVAVSYFLSTLRISNFEVVVK
jgi:hypothetical protein